MRYLFMDDQLNTQGPNPVTSISKIPTPEKTLATEEPILTPAGEPTYEKTPVTPISETPTIEETPISFANPVSTTSTSAPTEKYQDILNQYAASQSETPTPESSVPTSVPNSNIPTSEPSIPTPEPSISAPGNVPPISPQPTPQPAPTEPTLSEFGITPPPAPQSNVFKVFFILALIIFILVATALGFVYFKSLSSPSSSTYSTSTSKITPTQVASGTCSLNDKTYNVGESFKAADGCNTCTCQSQDAINCTSNECLSANPATKSATPTKTVTSSTSSATKNTSTSSAVTKTK